MMMRMKISIIPTKITEPIKYNKLDQVPPRDKIKIGSNVSIVQKQDQRTGKLTDGIVKRILTSSSFHPHGIKVELQNGKIGRVQKMA